MFPQVIVFFPPFLKSFIQILTRPNDYETGYFSTRFSSGFWVVDWGLFTWLCAGMSVFFYGLFIRMEGVLFNDDDGYGYDEGDRWSLLRNIMESLFSWVFFIF